MPGRAQTEMPRAALPNSGIKPQYVIFWIAVAVSSLFVVVQIGFAVTLTPVVLRLLGGESAGLPLLGLFQQLGPVGIVAFLGIADALIFAAFAFAARRYWIGLLFVPPLLYVLSAFSLFAAWWPAVASL